MIKSSIFSAQKEKWYSIYLRYNCFTIINTNKEVSLNKNINNNIWTLEYFSYIYFSFQMHENLTKHIYQLSNSSQEKFNK